MWVAGQGGAVRELVSLEPTVVGIAATRKERVVAEQQVAGAELEQAAVALELAGDLLL